VTAVTTFGALVAEPAGLAMTAAAAEAVALSPVEYDLAARINQDRADRGLPALEVRGVLVDQSRAWSAEQARTGRLSHHPDLWGEAFRADERWVRYGENVGVGTETHGLHEAFMASDTHRANVLGDFEAVGVGVSDVDGRLWVTVRFLKTG